MKIVGGCLCGQVRYRSNEQPNIQIACHCRHCQKQSGSAFSINLEVSKASLTVTGELQTYVDIGISTKAVYRRFCGRCGSPIVMELQAEPDLAILKAGTLDEVSDVSPSRHIFCQHRQEWFNIPESAEQLKLSF